MDGIRKPVGTQAPREHSDIRAVGTCLLLVRDQQDPCAVRRGNLGDRRQVLATPIGGATPDEQNQSRRPMLDRLNRCGGLSVFRFEAVPPQRF